MINKFKKINKKNGGALLLELLIVISLLGIILAVSANATFLSLRSNKTSGERDVSSSLAAEALEAVRSVSDEDFQNIYGLTKSTQHYYATQSFGKWIIATGDETVVLNGITYTRYLIFDDTCRDDTSRNITGIIPCSVGSSDDPSTQQVVVRVTLENIEIVKINEYLFRWKNKICNQDQWNGGKTFPADPAPVGSNCPTQTTYYDDDGNIDSTTIPGSLMLK